MLRHKSFVFSIMDGPFEQARTTTAMRIMDAALRRGHSVGVFAYEGAVGLPLALQQKHANAVHGNDVEDEDHVLPREWVATLMGLAEEQGARFDWVNCGLCVDERGAGEWIPGCRRGGPPDLWTMASESDNTLVIGTR